MLFLLFQLGADRYAIEAQRVAEVLPLVQVKAVPQAPRGVAGLINYRGQAVPVVDLSATTVGRPAALRLSTRLIVVRTTDTASGFLALLAEQATDSARIDAAEFTSSGVNVAGAPYLGPVAKDAEGRLVQWIDWSKLLPADVREALLVPGVLPA